VLGTSGSGKSSVIFAGLIPRLRQEGNWLILSLRPGGRPNNGKIRIIIKGGIHYRYVITDEEVRR